MKLTNIQKIDNRVSLYIVLQVTLMGMKNILVQGIPYLMELNGILNIVIAGLVMLLYMHALILAWSRRICGSGVFFALYILLSIGVSYLAFPDNVDYMQDYYIRWIVVFFFTAYLVVKLNNLEWLQKYMLYGSYLMTMAGVLYVIAVRIIGHSATSDWSSYSMSMSNVLMWAVMWQLHAFFKKENIFSIIFALIGVFIIVIYGSRNPLLAILSYSFILIYDRSASKRLSSKILIILFTAIVFLIALNLQSVVGGMFHSLQKYGMSSRTLSLVMNADTEDFSTGRNDIHNEVEDLVWDNYLFGTGVCGDEANLQEMSHSFYLNIFTTYGVVIGTVFLISIIVLVIKGLRKSKGLEHQILVMYICMVFPRGFTGGDMWGSDVFWWLMGIVFMILSNKQRIRKNAISNIRKENFSMA